MNSLKEIIEQTERRNSGREWLLRVEMWCARNFAEAVADAQQKHDAPELVNGLPPFIDGDMYDWYWAWHTVKSLASGTFPIYKRGQS